MIGEDESMFAVPLQDQQGLLSLPLISSKLKKIRKIV
jgi:hypothetical protein